jgi:hypothetical protein
MKVSTGKNRSVPVTPGHGSPRYFARKAAIFLKLITGKDKDDGENRSGLNTFPLRFGKGNLYIFHP